MLRGVGAWLQWSWILGPAGLVAVTAAGVVRGGPSHPGMPLAWTPLVSIITGTGVGLVLVAVFGAALRLLVAARMPSVAARPDIAADLHRRAAEPPSPGERFGRWRLLAVEPATATLVPGVALRRVGRIALALLGLVLLAGAAVATPAVLQTRGGGGDLMVTAAGGLVLLGLAMRPGPRPWRCPPFGDACTVEARVIRHGGGRPGRRRLIVRRAEPGRRPVRVLAVDLPGWPESAVRRHRLALMLPADVAEVVRGGPGGAVPGDRGLPAAAAVAAAPSSRAEVSRPPSPPAATP